MVLLLASWFVFHSYSLCCSTEKEEGLQYQRRLEASSNAAGPSMRNRMMRSSTSLDRKLRWFYLSSWQIILRFDGIGLCSFCIYFSILFSYCLSLSHSEPNIATTFWRRSRRKVIAEQRTASSRFSLPMCSHCLCDTIYYLWNLTWNAICGMTISICIAFFNIHMPQWRYPTSLWLISHTKSKNYWCNG